MSNDCRVVTGTAIGVRSVSQIVSLLFERECVAALQLAIDLRAQGLIAVKAIVIVEALCRAGASLLVKSRRRRQCKRVNVVVCQRSQRKRGDVFNMRRRVDGGLGRLGSCLLQKRCRAASRGRPSRTRALTTMIRLLGWLEIAVELASGRAKRRF